ncbi:MAG TPA: class I tRNA ligase family protein, partial [Candidatus Paceibacterota bacterium]|nr:class I tRNA ligase family protein [Candidatus Paceibacterota bacterium]
PFAPHIAEELWQESEKGSVHSVAWPSYDPKLLLEDEVVIAIQIDGKTRDEVRVASGADKATTEKAAREKVASRLEGKTVARVVVVPNRLVNFVTS